MRKEGARGWVLELIESLGFLHMPVDKPGGCNSCYAEDAAVLWILDSLKVIHPEGETLFGVPLQILFSWSYESELSNVHTGSVVIEHEDDRASFLADFERFASSPQTRSMTIHVTLVWTGFNEGHATSIFLQKEKDSKITLTVIDPHGEVIRNVRVAETIMAFLAKHTKGKFTFSYKPSTFGIGPQAMEKLTESSLGTGGNCTNWTAINQIIAVAADGATPDEIIRDLTACFVRGSKGVANFISIFSRNMARLVREQAASVDASRCLDLNCCEGASYCDEPKTEFFLRTKEGYLMFLSGTALGSHIKYEDIGEGINSSDGIEWFPTKHGGMLGIIFNPDAGNFSEGFKNYLALYNQAADTSIGLAPRMVDQWYSPSAVKMGFKDYDAGFILLDHIVYPLNIIFDKEIPNLIPKEKQEQLLNNFLKFSLKTGSTLDKYFFQEKNFYTDAQAVHVPVFLNFKYLPPIGSGEELPANLPEIYKAGIEFVFSNQAE
jgi:hypothetical protein